MLLEFHDLLIVGRFQYQLVDILEAPCRRYVEVSIPLSYYSVKTRSGRCRHGDWRNTGCGTDVVQSRLEVNQNELWSKQ
jgi:hypothetical protein